MEPQRRQHVILVLARPRSADGGGQDAGDAHSPTSRGNYYILNQQFSPDGEYTKNSENYLDAEGASQLVKALVGEVEGVEWIRSRPPLPTEGGPAVDLVVEVLIGGRVVPLRVGVRQTGEPRMLQRFAGEVEAAGEGIRGHPVLVAPFVSSRGRELCKRLGLGFVDTAGNAHLNVPGLLVERSGRENPRRERRELRGLFSRKASWVSRRLFAEPGREWTMAELSEEAGVSLGHVKKVVDRLTGEALVEKAWGAIRLSDPGGLLDMWRESYVPQPWTGYHSTLRGQEDLVERMGAVKDDGWALTLGGGATQVAPFVRSTDVHVYVQEQAEHLRETVMGV
jgi:hypothetical protein